MWLSKQIRLRENDIEIYYAKIKSCIETRLSEMISSMLISSIFNEFESRGFLGIIIEEIGVHWRVIFTIRPDTRIFNSKLRELINRFWF